MMIALNVSGVTVYVNAFLVATVSPKTLADPNIKSEVVVQGGAAYDVYDTQAALVSALDAVKQPVSVSGTSSSTVTLQSG